MYYPLGILVPMAEEVELLVQSIEQPSETFLAERIFYKGTLHGKQVVVAQSGIGKVASSFTASLLIHRFGAKAVLVTGVAGGIGDPSAVGDLAIALEAIQHDMDCRPLFPQFEIPTKGITRYGMDPTLTQKLEEAAWMFLAKDSADVVGSHVLESLHVQKPRIFTGLLVSGDQFIGTLAQWQKLKEELPESLFVEMEGAAVAQVCHDSNIPMCSIRTISDKANEAAHVDFNRFLSEAAKLYTAGIVKRFVELL